MRGTVISATGLAMLILATGCEGDGEGTSNAPAAEGAAEVAAPVAPHVLTLTTGDFFFRGPSSAPAGMTTIRLVNDGPELHHVQLIRLEEGRTMGELMDAVAAGGMVPEWAREVGGPNTPAPGARSETTLDLEAGEYALVCVIPSSDGVPHLMKGMAVPFSVTPSSRPAAPEPDADVRMTLTDYAFAFDDIAAGPRTIRVENLAEQAHEVIVARLAPGKTVEDLVAWLEKPEGPPPGEPLGGTTAMARGEVNFVTIDFTSGEYGLLCMVPDVGDRKPHVAHGMARQITIR